MSGVPTLTEDIHDDSRGRFSRQVHAFGRVGHVPLEWERQEVRPKAETDNHVFLAHGEGGSAIVKIYRDTTRFAHKEVLARALITDPDLLRLPAVLEYQIAHVPSYVAIEYVRGIPLSRLSRQDMLRSMPKVIDLAYSVHQVKLDQYGELVEDSWRSESSRHLNVYLEGERFYWSNGIRSWSGLCGAKRYADLIAELPLLEPILSQGPTLVHSDITPANVLVDDQGLRLIDFDNVFALIPEFDLCKTWLSLQVLNARLTLSVFAELVAERYSQSCMEVEAALKGMLWVPIVRLLHYHRRRSDQDSFLKLWHLFEAVQNGSLD